MNKTTKQTNKVGQDFIGPMLFHRIMSANTKEIRLTWDADHPRLYKLKKDDLNKFWCPYTSTVHQMSNTFNIALGCSASEIKNDLFVNFGPKEFIGVGVKKEPGKCFQ